MARFSGNFGWHQPLATEFVRLLGVTPRYGQNCTLSPGSRSERPTLPAFEPAEAVLLRNTGVANNVRFRLSRR